MNFIRYEESRPEAMRAMIKESPVAYVPFGSLEWHGEHAPLGVDGLKAHALCEAAAERTGGVVFPTIYWGAFDTMPFPFTFHFKKSGIRNLARETLKQLAGWNFKAIVLLTGHYPASQVTAAAEGMPALQQSRRCAGHRRSRAGLRHRHRVLRRSRRHVGNLVHDGHTARSRGLIRDAGRTADHGAPRKIRRHGSGPDIESKRGKRQAGDRTHHATACRGPEEGDG